MNAFEFNIFIAILCSMCLLAAAFVFWINHELAIQCWWTNLKWAVSRRLSKVPYRIAAWMPRWLVYHCVIRAGVHATTGRWSNQEVPAVTLMDIMKRWEQPK